MFPNESLKSISDAGPKHSSERPEMEGKFMNPKHKSFQ